MTQINIARWRETFSLQMYCYTLSTTYDQAMLQLIVESLSYTFLFSGKWSEDLSTLLWLWYKIQKWMNFHGKTKWDQPMLLCWWCLQWYRFKQAASSRLCWKRMWRYLHWWSFFNNGKHLLYCTFNFNSFFKKLLSINMITQLEII